MSACNACLSRALLLRDLAAHIERSVGRTAGSRSRELLALPDARLAEAVNPGDPAGSLDAARTPRHVKGLREELDRLGCWAVCPHEHPPPPGLEALGDEAPRALFGRGDQEFVAGVDPGAAVTVVGSRRASAYGREVALELSRLLASSGLEVISGMAFGIDTAAHEGALLSGRTVAVLGTGPERPYPRTRSKLYAAIAGSGAVLSELPPGTPTFRWMFPARNRLMAAMAGLTVVVEAAERSGSLITAEMALDIGRPVGAVPGPVSSWRSAGTNQLLADGALVIRDARDALECLLGPGATPPPRVGPAIDARAARALAAVESGAATADAVALACGLAAAEAGAALTLLELDQYVASDAAGRYRRTAQAAQASPAPGANT